MSYPNRPPDLDLPTFRIWKEKVEDGDKFSGSAITLESDKGELVNESRVYNHLTSGYSILILSKRRDNRIWMVSRGKRGDGSTFMDAKKDRWLTEDEYEEEIDSLERSFSAIGFDTEHPTITSGKAYNVYL